MGQIIRVGLDTSKQVFQVHGVGADEAVALRRRLRRRDVVEFFRRLPPALIGLEACGGSHHWARVLGSLGHEVRLIPPQYVKPYVKRGKNDMADAAAICEAVSRPDMRFVPVKTPAEQAALMLVTVREQLVRGRTRLINAIRGHAAEFGLVAPKGPRHVATLLAEVAADETLPVLAKELFAVLGEECAELSERIREVEAELQAWRRQDERAQRLTALPGVGPIGAVLLSCKVPNPRLFRSGRQFAAWLGLTPRDHSTAGKTRLGGITRAGDELLRSTLIVGATAVIRQVRQGKHPGSPWLCDLLQRKTPKQAAVALANKTARIAWKLMVSGETYRPSLAA